LEWVFFFSFPWGPLKIFFGPLGGGGEDKAHYENHASSPYRTVDQSLPFTYLARTFFYIHWYKVMGVI